jgi:hypothetical protein
MMKNSLDDGTFTENVRSKGGGKIVNREEIF